jgi:KUP system potassium uptake protein
MNAYQATLRELSNDQSIPKYATHLVYLTGSGRADKIEERIIESILFQQPKRADIYWLINIEVTDEPYSATYQVNIVEPEEIVYVKFKLGFRIVPRVNLLFKKVVGDMAARQEVHIDGKYCNISKKYVGGDFRFVVMKSFLSVENDLSFRDNIIMRLHFMLDKISLPDDKSYGLDYSNVVVEHVPLMLGATEPVKLTREE